MLIQYLNYQLYSKPATFDKRVQMTSYYQERECDVNTAYAIITDGRTWRCGRYDLEAAKGFGKSNVIDVHFIALDFDKIAASPRDIVEYAINIGFMPNFYYYSYSQGIKPGNNFRVVWCLAEPITPTMYENLYRLLLEKFSCFNPDKSTKDCSRLWYGNYGQGGGIVSEKPLSLANIGFINLAALMEDGKTATQAKRTRTNGVPKYVELDIPDKVNVIEGWQEHLNGYCSLWDKWCKGEYLNYNERLVLFTNLKYLESADGNKKIPTLVLQSNPNWKQVYEGHSFDENQLLTIMKSKLSPLPIVFYQNKWMTVAEFFKIYTPAAEKITEVKKIRINELDAIMDAEMPKLLSSPKSYYIKAQTGSGKTERIIKWMLKQDLKTKKIIYAVPGYNQIIDFKNRFQAAVRQQGFGTYCDSLFEDIFHDIPKSDYTAKDLMRIKLGLKREIKDKVRNTAIFNMVDKNSHGVFVCTHALITRLSGFSADVIIVDENIEDSLITRVNIEKSSISKLNGFLTDTNREAASKLLQFMDETDVLPVGGRVNRTLLNEILAAIEPEEYLEKVEEKDLIEHLFLLSSNHIKIKKGISETEGSWILRVSGVSPLFSNAFTNNIPVKLFTATPKPQLLDNYLSEYSQRLERYSFPETQHEGKIIQYIKYSGSKGEKDDKVENELFPYIQEVVPNWQDYYLITFKSCGEMAEKMGFKMPYYEGKILHFDNSAGIDTLKGENLIIAGKYNLPLTEWKNELIDISDGVPCLDLHNIKMTLERNGRKFTTWLYDNPIIQERQIEHLEEKTSQAAGRARTLRNNGNRVIIFNDFPIEDADEVIGDLFIEQGRRSKGGEN